MFQKHDRSLNPLLPPFLLLPPTPSVLPPLLAFFLPFFVVCVFPEIRHCLAFRDTVTTFLEANGRGYWETSEENIELLQDLYQEVEDKIEGV